MQTIDRLTTKALTAARETSTTARRPNTRDSAERLELETLGEATLESMAVMCCEFMNAFDAGQSPRWLTLMGASDTGKTHCASRVFRHLNERSDNHRTKWTPRKVFWPEFVLRLRDPDGNARQQLFDLMTWPVLFLDDIGAERDTTGFATEQLNALLGVRVGRWTILTSNLSLQQIAKVEPRISSRIVRERGNLFVVVTAKSYALRRLNAAPSSAGLEISQPAATTNEIP